MTADQIAALSRGIINFLCGLLVAHGVINSGQGTALTTALVAVLSALPAIFSIGWAIYSNRKTAKIQSVAAMPDTLVVTTPTIANSPEFKDNPSVISAHQVEVKP